MKAAPCLSVAVLVAVVACVEGDGEEERMGATLSVTSTAFLHEGSIPPRHACDGDDISPDISWEGLPEATRSVALICDDPDAVGVWVHWVVFNIPADVGGLPEGVPGDATLSNGALQGENSWGSIGYGGPCPPTGSHHYIFTVYALDVALPLEAGASKRAVLDAMSGHVLAQGELVGVYPG